MTLRLVVLFSPRSSASNLVPFANMNSSRLSGRHFSWCYHGSVIKFLKDSHANRLRQTHRCHQAAVTSAGPKLWRDIACRHGSSHRNRFVSARRTKTASIVRLTRPGTSPQERAGGRRTRICRFLEGQGAWGVCKTAQINIARKLDFGHLMARWVLAEAAAIDLERLTDFLLERFPVDAVKTVDLSPMH